MIAGLKIFSGESNIIFMCFFIKSNYVIISSYASGAPWSQTIISHIMQKKYNQRNISMKVEYMNILIIETPEILR